MYQRWRNPLLTGMTRPLAVVVEQVTPDEAREQAGQVWTEATSFFSCWLEGDETGLNGLVGVMTPVLWHVVRAYHLDTEHAEDVIQATWLALVRRREAIEDPTAVGGWLTTTARREAWRVSKKANTDLPTDDEMLAHRTPAEPSAEAQAVLADEHRALWDAVHSLSQRCQRLLRIIAFENRPDYTNLATELGMPVGSIGPTRGRCLEKLRACVADQMKGGQA
jgi:RNA polymerase sigma factor (sigma-70 family)